jgi:prepilin-type N-terminal cleavage/methylation domain-containing protein
MKPGNAAGFTLVEMVIAAALMCVVSGVLLQLAVAAQQAVSSQGDLADLQQRLRVAATIMQADLLMAGAGPSQGPGRGSLGGAFPPVLPARTGRWNPDPEMFHATDRFTVLYVPDSASQSALAADSAGPAAPLLIEAGLPGCPPDGACGFAPGDRALVFDPSGSGAYDLFTVGAAGAGQLSSASASGWSHPYLRGSPVVAVTQRVYYLDRATGRLMLYDGDQSDGPLIDHVADLQVSYYAGPAWQELTAAELADGPALGAGPNRFDADLLRVRRIRVTLTIEAPGSSTGLDARLRRRRVSFDVTPRNLGVPH